MNNKKRSQKRERAAATDIGGRAHIASGALWFRKADLSNANFLVEDKFTDAHMYRITLANLLKVEKHANAIGKIPVFRFGFEQTGYDFVLVNINDYNNYQGASESIDVDGKSISLKLTGLSALVSKTEDIVLAQLNFKEKDKKFLLISWRDFVDHQSDFWC